MSTKVQCDLCRLSYSTEKELLDHSLSLMHHTKLEDREKNSLHECPLCSIVCSNMADYRRHISADIHQKNLSDFKGDQDRKNDIFDSRKNIQISTISFPCSSWSDDTTLNDSNKKEYVTDINSRRDRVQDEYNGNSEWLDKSRQNGSHIRFNSDKAHTWDSDSWKSRYNYRNDLYHWSRDGYLNQENNRDISKNNDFKIPHGQKNSHFQPGTKVSSGYCEFNNSGKYSEMSRMKSDEERVKISLPVYSYALDVPCNMDFTTDIVPSDWDENSFLEHEQFLHGVDSTYHSDRFNLVRASNRLDVGKWEESSVRDRKRPRNEDDVQELLVKSSRSIDSSSDEHFPVRDVPKRHSGVFSTPSSHEVKPAANSYPDFKMQTKMSSIDNASNNILERAERLCKELRQKREASEAHKNLQLKKQNHEPLNQKMSHLPQKQQMDIKVNIVNSKKLQSEETFNSSAKQLQDSRKVAFPSSKKPSIDSDAAEILVRASDNTFSSVNKSVEKRVLENKKTGTNNFSIPHKSKQRSLSGGDIDLDKMKKGKEGIIDISGKPLLNPMSKLLLNKDNLKKMVNTPNSRDERLQLIKMLHSRTEQKTAAIGTPRTHLQLEGLYDSVFATNDVNLDLGRTFDSQTIKLENLSEGVRQQIMDLIGSDVSSQPMKHSETGLKCANGIRKTPQEDVIILSDNEDLRNRKNKKNAARKMSGSSTSVLGDTIKINKKKKIATKPSSNIDVKNSVSFSNSKSSITNQSRNSRPTSPVQKSNVMNKDTSLSSSNKFHVISHSSDLEHGKGKDSLQKENAFHGSSNTLLISKKNSMLDNSFDYKTKDVPCRAYSNSQSQFDSCSIREKFPTLLKIPKTDKTPPVQNNVTLVGSEVASIHSPPQNSADKYRDVSPAFLNSEADINEILPKAEVKPSLTQIDWKTPSSEVSVEMASLKAQKSSNIASLQNTWLENRTSSLHHYENQHMPFTNNLSVPSSADLMSDRPVFSPEFKNSTFKETPSMDLLLLSDLDDRSADGNALSVGVGRPVIADVAVGTSQTMTTLLMLSEKEEYVKQEKMSMDLRLSRLHKLLEQAVVQISKCTERMNKLHEEEQELLKKRLSLLRVATSLQPNRRCVVLNEMNTALETKSLAKSENDGADFHMTQLPSDSETRSFDISQSVINSNSSALPLAENGHSIALSKADWLAKFSSFLPQDTATTSSKITATESVSLASIPAMKEQPHLSYSSFSRDGTLMKLNISKTQPERDIVSEMVDVEMDSDKLHKSCFKPVLPDNLSQVSSSAAADKQKGPIEANAVENSANSLPVTADSEPVIHSLISAPIMYVGSFRRTDQSMRLISPFVMERSDTLPPKSLTDTSNHFDSDRHLMVTNCQREDSDIPTHDSVFADLMHLPSPSRSHSMGKSNEFGGEESDIGSMASGSSLGEQITQYCRSTPGASLDSRDAYGAHELSVIMSDTSEQRALDSSAEENDKSDAWLRKEEHWHSNVRPCSVSVERLDRKFTDIYGSLDEKVVRSAKALHLIERNSENTVGQSGIESDNGKRRKRKTKQERDTTGFTRRRSHWITVSSSEDEGSGSSKQRISSDMDSTVFKAKTNGLSSSVQKSDHCVLETGLNNTGSDCEDVVIVDHRSHSKRMDSSDMTIDPMRFLSPSKSASYLDVTVAECDSSTSMGAVDSESTFQVSTRKEMRKNFDQLSDVSPKSSSPDPFHSNNNNSSMTDVILGRNGSLLNRSDHLSSLSYTPVSDSSRSIPTGGDSPLNNQFARTLQSSELSVHSTLNQTRYSENVHPKFSWKTSLEVGEEIKSTSSSRNNCCFPGGFGPVFDIHVVKGQMYVGHNNKGVRVYNFSGLNQGKVVKEYAFPHLQCMTYKEHDEAVTLILGNGSDLVFCNSKEQSQQRYNLGTAIKCLLLWSHLVYAGLDTGEICIFDTLRMVLKDRCICSDHPIHCLASGKEGAAKLLCVSSQDGTIIVLDAQQFLPIRILRGHSKTAFSIQVEGHLVFSGSGDHTVLTQNLHTAEVEHVYSDSRGLVKSICYNKGCLFTGGMDKLVRCYDVKTHKLLQVYYGADRGVVTKILVLDNMLITGNISGSVDVVDIDIEARHRCHIAGCTLAFGNQSHLRWHILEDHSI